MSDNKKRIVDLDLFAMLFFVFLFIVTFWGEPDLLDLLLIKLGG